MSRVFKLTGRPVGDADELARVEWNIADWKKRIGKLRRAGRPVPDYMQQKIKELKRRATALREGENR